jgi:hypothetical protein
MTTPTTGRANEDRHCMCGDCDRVMPFASSLTVCEHCARDLSSQATELKQAYQNGYDDAVRREGLATPPASAERSPATRHTRGGHPKGGRRQRAAEARS